MTNEMLQYYRTGLAKASELTTVGAFNFYDNDAAGGIYLAGSHQAGPNPTHPSRLGAFTSTAFSVQNPDESVALSDFAILVQPHPQSTAITLISGSTWGTVAGILKHKVGALNTLAAGATGYGYVDIGPCYSMAFMAKSGATELLTNGTFTSNANSWTLGTGIAYGTNNVAFTAASDTLVQAKADMASSGADWVDNYYYEVVFTISSYSAGNLAIGTAATPSQYLNADGEEIQLGDGTYSALIQSDGADDGLIFTATGFTGVIDTVSLKRCATPLIRGCVFR